VEVPGEAVEVPDVVPAPGQQGGVVSVGDLLGPDVRHLDERLCTARAEGGAATGEVPVDGLVDVPVAELAQGAALGGVVLADVAVEGGEDLGAARQEAGEGAAGSDGGELAGVADEDELRPCSLDVGHDPVKVVIGGHGGLVEDHDGAVVEGRLLARRHGHVVPLPTDASHSARDSSLNVQPMGGPSRLLPGALWSCHAWSAAWPPGHVAM